VTWPEDLRLAEAILRARHACSPARVGLGIDIHRLVPGRRLILGGVELPPEAAGGRGLLGHSDADVVLHAVMDACLGAAGEADIGELFPPDDDRYRDADSALLLGEVRRRLRERGLVVGSVDITVVAEVPKLRPHKARLRQRLAELLEISEDRVGLKATTPERLGWLGREEGVLAVAVAELVAARCPHEV
jgi:2-C-methyl-D-erythritol 2,4-cyclodiphosphate synthase